MKTILALFIGILLLPQQAHASAVPSNDTLAIKELFVQAMEYQDYDNDSSWLLAEQGFIQSKKINYKAGIGMAFMRFGALMNIKGKSDSALYYFQQAFNIRKEVKNLPGMAAICQQMSYVYRNMGQKDSAFFYLFEAQRLFDQSNDSVAMAGIYVELANLNTNYKDYKAAKQYLDQALPLFIKHENQALIYQTYIEYGSLYFKQSENTKALSYYLKAKKVNDLHLLNPSYTAAIYNYLGLCYDEIGNKKMTIAYFEKGIEAYKALEMPHEVALLAFNLGNLYIGIKQVPQGIYHLEQSKKIALEIQDNDRLSRCYELLSDAYVLKGDYLNAYSYYTLYHSLSDSLLSLEKVKQIAEMNVLYETEKKIQEIKLLNAQNIAKETKNNLLLITSTLLFIIVSGLVYLYIQKNKLARKNELLAREQIQNLMKEQEIKSFEAMIEGQEEERTRIANDLHDRLGSMLSTVKLLFSALDTKIEKAVDENKTQYDRANYLLDEACAEVRRISHNLSTGLVSTFGLNAAIEDLGDSINNSNLIKCKLLIYGNEERLDQKLEVAIYRIIQEIVNNIIKHAKAKTITIQLNRNADSINITVEDDGIGFNVEEKMKSGGMGLANIMARAKKIEAVYHIDSSMGRGTISIIEIPINTTNHD